MSECPNLDFNLLAAALSEPVRKRVTNCGFKSKVMDFIKKNNPEEIISANSLLFYDEIKEFFVNEIEIRAKLIELYKECWQKLLSHNESLSSEKKLPYEALEIKCNSAITRKAKAIRLWKINSVIKELTATGHLRKDKSAEGKDGFIFVRTEKQ